MERKVREDEDTESIDLNFNSPTISPDAVLIITTKNGDEYRLKIEFEGYSKNFEVHKHPRDICDLIVCTYHNWVDVPVPVWEADTGNTFKPGEGLSGTLFEIIESSKKKKK